MTHYIVREKTSCGQYFCIYVRINMGRHYTLFQDTSKPGKRKSASWSSFRSPSNWCHSGCDLHTALWSANGVQGKHCAQSETLPLGLLLLHFNKGCFRIYLPRLEKFASCFCTMFTWSSKVESDHWMCALNTFLNEAIYQVGSFKIWRRKVFSSKF